MPGAVGEVAQQAAHPEDALGVEAVGGLVEDQHLRVAEQRVGDAEPLAHAERVVADALLGGRLRETDALEQLVDPRAWHAEDVARRREHLAAGTAGVLRRGVEQHADVAARVVDVYPQASGTGRDSQNSVMAASGMWK